MGNLVYPEAQLFQATDQSRQIEKILRELGNNLCAMMMDPTVIEILYNADGTLWLERLGKPMEPVGILSASRAESLIYSIAAYHKTAITRENPILECELPPYSARFEALIPPVVARPIFSIRCRPHQIFTLLDYVAAHIMTESQKEHIMTAVRMRKNILVVGGTGSGKTTLTNAIIAEMVRITPDHRLVIIEDTAEIQCGAKNAALLHAVDRVDMLRLLKASMRLRPDRILVGEVRGPEALALLKAWNTGHPGGVATLHANNARAGLIRLEQLIAETTTSEMNTVIGEAVDLVISIQKTTDSRKIAEIIQVEGYNQKEGYQIKPLNT